MNTKTTVVLAVLVLAGGVLMFVDAPWKDAATKGRAGEPKSTGGPQRLIADPPKTDAVQRIDIQVGDKPTITCVQDENNWQVTEPIACPAESYLPNNIVRRCLTMTYVRRFAPGDDGAPSAEEAGLDKPLSTISIYAEELSEPIVIRFGRQAPLSSDHYVSLQGDDGIYVVTENVRNTFVKTLEEIRSKRIFDFGGGEAVAVSVTGRQNYEMRRDDADWIIEKPIRTRAERTKASSMVSSVRNLRAVEFVDDQAENLSPYGLDRPSWTIQVVVEKKTAPPAEPVPPTPGGESEGEGEAEGADADDTKQTEEPQPTIERSEYQLLVGGPAGDNVYAKLADQPWVFTIQENTLKNMAPDLTDLMARQLFDFSKNKIEKIELQVAGAETTLEKDGADWMLGNGRKAEPIAVDDLLNTMRDLKAVSFQEKPPLLDTGLDSPRAIVALTVQGRDEPIRALVGNSTASGKMVYVRSGDDPTIALLRADSVAALLTPPVGYRDRQILDFNRNNVYRIEIERDGTPIVLNRSEDGTWRMTQPIDAPADATSVSNILADLNNLRAIAVTAEDSGSAYGLDEPWVRATFGIETEAPIGPLPATDTETEAGTETEEGSDTAEPDDKSDSEPAATTERSIETFTVLMSANRKGKVYARRDDGELVYEIDYRIMNNLVAELHDRRAFPIGEAADVMRMSISNGADTVAFERIGDKWIAEADPALPIDGGKITAALNMFKAIKTGRFVNYQATDLVQYALDIPAISISVRNTDGSTVQLDVSGTGPENNPEKSRYATLNGSNKVFLLELNYVGKLNKSLGDFESAE